jgi:hypothetical protein
MNMKASARALGMAGLLCAMTCCARQTAAHDHLSEFVQHRVQISVRPPHIDVTVQLSFFETWSRHERRRMDSNKDGRISRTEIDSYMASLATNLITPPLLVIDGQPVELTPLYCPEVNLLGSDTVGRAHHRLTLFWFGPIPSHFKAGSLLALEDRLWPGAPALMDFRNDCESGALFAPEDPSGIAAPEWRGESRRLKLLCVRLNPGADESSGVLAPDPNP